MVAGNGRFIAVRLGYLNLPVPTVAINCGKYCCISQRVNALVHSSHQVRIPRVHCVKLSVVDPKRQFSFFLQGKHHTACPFQHCGLDHAFSARSGQSLDLRAVLSSAMPDTGLGILDGSLFSDRCDASWFS